MASIIAKVSRSLKGIHFPADRRKCVECAKMNMAPDEVLNALQQLPEREFDSMANVWHAVSKEKPSERQYTAPIRHFFYPYTFRYRGMYLS
jgi:hypothetical protein